MHILKLNATDSTNSYLKAMFLSEKCNDFTVVWAHDQLNGKGQMGATWLTEPGKNLTFSVLKKFDNLKVIDQFTLNIGVSLAVIDALKGLSIPNLSVKWPNDILSGSSKVCGILIENILVKDQIQASVIGIGLNVNQLRFNNLSNVASLKLLLGHTVNLEELLQSILMALQTNFKLLQEQENEFLWKAYENNLFRKDKPSTFKNVKGELFMGFIRKVSPNGKLVVELEDAIFQDFDLKEIQLLY